MPSYQSPSYLAATSPLSPSVDPLAQRLPTELWYIILHMCWSSSSNRRSNRSLPSVCTLFRDILDPLRFERLPLGGYFLDPGEAKSLRTLKLYEHRPARLRYVRELSFHGTNLKHQDSVDRFRGRPVQPRLSRLFLQLLSSQPTKVPNLATLQLSNCVLDAVIVHAMENLPNLSSLHISSVDVRNLSTSHLTSKFRLSELLLFSVRSSEADLITLASTLSNPNLTCLTINDQVLPAGLLGALSSSTSPGHIEHLDLMSSSVVDQELCEFLACNPGIRSIHYDGTFTFSSLPSSALPILERCSIYNLGINYLICGRPIVDVRTVVNRSPGVCTTLLALAQSTKPLRRLTIQIPEFEPSTFDSITRCFSELEELEVKCIWGIQRDMLETVIRKILPLRALRRLCLPTVAPDSSLAYPVTLSHNPPGRLGLLWQEGLVKEMGAQCPDLHEVTLRPVSWVCKSEGKWQPYPDSEHESEEIRDEPLEMPTQMKDAREREGA